MILELVETAVASGARRERACDVVGLSHRTVERWRGDDVGDDARAGPRTCPANALSAAERANVWVNVPEGWKTDGTAFDDYAVWDFGRAPPQGCSLQPGNSTGWLAVGIGSNADHAYNASQIRGMMVRPIQRNRPATPILIRQW